MLEIGQAVIERPPVERLVDGKGRAVGQQQRIAVGRRLGDPRRAGHAAGAADILDDDLLAERLAHARAENARDGVDRPAGGKGHDQVDRPRRPALRLRRDNGRGPCGGYGGEHSHHGVSPNADSRITRELA